MALTEIEREMLRSISRRGVAAEVEVQVDTLMMRKEFRRELEILKKMGAVRKIGFCRPGYGEVLELTPYGYRSVNEE